MRVQEASTKRLVSLRGAALAAGGAEWAGAALALGERYLRHEPRRAVRRHTLRALLAFVERYRCLPALPRSRAARRPAPENRRNRFGRRSQGRVR